MTDSCNQNNKMSRTATNEVRDEYTNERDCQREVGACERRNYGSRVSIVRARQQRQAHSVPPYEEHKISRTVFSLFLLYSLAVRPLDWCVPQRSFRLTSVSSQFQRQFVSQKVRLPELSSSTRESIFSHRPQAAVSFNYAAMTRTKQTTKQITEVRSVMICITVCLTLEYPIE